MKNKLNFLALPKDIKLTELRKDVLSILFSQSGPIGAYDILSQLKNKRASAEPPTVYRVLEFLTQAKLIHRIESQNTYVCCEHLLKNNSLHQAVLLFCSNCKKSYEYTDSGIFTAVKKFAKKNKLKVDDTLIEIKGTCENCLSF